MEPTEYKTMFAVEDRHWWYAGMREITTRMISSLYPGRTNLHILDAGCGTGAAMQYMSPFGAVTGCDMSGLALDFCRQRNLSRLAQSWVTRLPFASERFDLVTSFDVLCHRTVGDYREGLAEFHRILKPGGRMMMRVPAYDWLRAHHDEVVHTEHRFTTDELRQALIATQFRPEKLSYANALLFPLAVGKRLAERFFPVEEGVSDIKANPPWQDKFLASFLYTEARWLSRNTLPFGLSVIAVGRKE